MFYVIVIQRHTPPTQTTALKTVGESVVTMNNSTMKAKSFHAPLKFIVLLLGLFLMQTAQAQSSCDSALNIPVNGADTFYLGSSDLWFKFQAPSEAVFLNLLTEGFVPQADVDDLVIYSGSCDDPLIHVITEDSINSRYVSGLVINDFYYIKVTPGDTAGLLVLSLIESNPIQVYFDYDCVPECDNLVFNGGFEVNVSHSFQACCNSSLNLPCLGSAVSWLFASPFQNPVVDNCGKINPLLPNQTYTNTVCQWGTFSNPNPQTPQIYPQPTNNTYAFMWAQSHHTESIKTNVFLKAGVQYIVSFDYRLWNSSTNATASLALYSNASPISFSSYINPPFSIFQSPQWTTNPYTIVFTPSVDIEAISFFPDKPSSGQTNLYIDNIKISPLPPQECPVISGPELVCPGTSNVTYTITNFDPVYIYKYSVNGGSLQVSNGGTIVIDITTITGNTVDLMVTNWCECETHIFTVISCDPSGMDYVFLDGEMITQTHFSDAKVFICGEIEIGASVTFDDNCELYFAPKSSLSVQSGYTLTLDESLLTDACLLPWNGVYANHSTSTIIVQNECTLQHAVNAIASKNGASLDITNSLFRNNETCIKIQKYDPYCPAVIDPLNPPPNTPPFPAYIADNVFTRDISISISGLQGPYTGILIDTVFELTIGDYTLPPGQVKNTFSNLDFGIKSSFSSVFVYNNLFENIATGAQTPNHNPANKHPLEGAVYAWSVPGIVNSGHAGPASPPPANSCIQKHITVGGLYQYQVNAFIDCNIGVYSDKHKVDIEGNTYDDQYFNAIYCIDPVSGSTVKSNTINQVLDHWALTPIHETRSIFDVAILLQNIKGTNAGKLININYNIVNNAKTGIGLTNLTSSILPSSSNKAIVNGNQIYFNNVSPLDKYWHGIRLEGCDRIFSGGNEVESSELGDAGGSEEHVIGIYVSQTPFASIHNNILKNLFSGIFVVGNCLSTQFYCNDLNGCQHGFYLKPYGNGVATAISDQKVFDNSSNLVPTDNVWINNLHKYRINGTLSNSPGSIDWYHRYTNDPPTIYSPHIIQSGNPLYNIIIPQENTTGTSPCGGLPIPVDENDWDGDIRSARLGAVVREEIDYVYLNEEFDYFDQETVYEWLYSNPDVMYLGEPDDSAYINFYNYMTNSTIAEVTNINELIEAGEINDALMHNGVFVASNLIENNMQVVNDIYLNTLAQDIMFDSIQRDALMSIAMLTPYLGGKAVYSARVMLGLDPRDYGLQHRLAPKTETEKNTGIQNLKVFPNPVTDLLTIEILEGMVDGTATAELFDLTGKKVFQTRIVFSASKAELHITETYKGLYLLKITTDTGSYKSIRVIVK